MSEEIVNRNTKKLIAVGGSTGIILDAKILQICGLEKGDEVRIDTVDSPKNGIAIILRPVRKKEPETPVTKSVPSPAEDARLARSLESQKAAFLNLIDKQQ